MAAIAYPAKVYSTKKVAWFWVPAIAVPSAPKVAEITAGIPIQCSIEADQFAFTGSMDTGSSQRYCESFVSDEPGQKKLDLGNVEVYADPQNLAGTDYAVATAWKAEPTGYLCMRAGIAHDTAVAAAQVLSIVAKTKIANLGPIAPKPSDATDGFRWNFQLLRLGDPLFDVAISA